jgi:CHAD domain-containing protein
MSKRKWEIDNLDDNLEFIKAADIILSKRLDQVIEDINNYLISDSVENLHRVRISLRRFRYSMELFISSFDTKKFMILYKKVTKLQDLSGRVRDFDVMEENMNSLVKKEKIKIPKKEIKKVDAIRDEILIKLKLDLTKFRRSKAVKDFEELLH